MKTIPALKLEVIYFNTEDVIVTSGLRLDLQASPIETGIRYATIGSELIEANVTQTTGRSPSSINDSDIYLFIFGENDGIHTVDQKWSQASNTTYAWHHINQWYTGSLGADDEDQLIPPLSKFTTFYSN